MEHKVESLRWPHKCEPQSRQVGHATLTFLIFLRKLAPFWTPEALAKSPLLPTLSHTPACSMHRGLGKPGLHWARKIPG